MFTAKMSLKFNASVSAGMTAMGGEPAYPVGAIVWMINGDNLLSNGLQVVSYEDEL